MSSSYTPYHIPNCHKLKYAYHSNEFKNAVFDKATPICGKNPNRFRIDAVGNQIDKIQYGKNSPQGWHKDHIIPKAEGGTNSLCNIQPLQTKANLQKGTLSMNEFKYKLATKKPWGLKN